MKKYYQEKKLKNYLNLVNSVKEYDSSLTELLGSDDFLLNHCEKIFDGGNESFYFADGCNNFIIIKDYDTFIECFDLTIILNKNNKDYFLSILDYIPPKWEISIDLYCDLPKEINNRFERIHLFLFSENKCNFSLKNVVSIRIKEENIFLYMDEWQCDNKNHEISTEIKTRKSYNMISYNII